MPALPPTVGIVHQPDFVHAGTNGQLVAGKVFEFTSNACKLLRVSDFGDGSSTDWLSLIASRRLTHRYGSAGTYTVALIVDLRDGSTRGDRQTVTVPAAR